MKILITGSGGMLGSSMIPVLREEGYDVYPTDKNPVEGIELLDVREYDQVLAWASRLQPDFIFHLAAETDLEICENDPEYAYSTNTIGTQNVALICKKLGIKMVYICTAGIFDGKKESFYNEFDEAIPLSIYGKTKLEGEKIVKEMLHEYFVCRPGWMVGGGAKDKKFVGQIIKQIRDGAKELHAVDDKFGTSTYTKDFCKNLAALIKTEHYGLYHMVSRGSASRYDVAKEIVKILNRPDITVHSVHSDYFAKRYPVTRPRSEMLDNLMLDLRGLNLMRNWREILPEYINEHFSDVILKNDINNMDNSESKNKKKFIVIGAGLAGLSTAYKLLQQGADVTILEKAKEVGGLARTIKYKDYYFDFSAHRFSASKKDLIEEMKQIMEGNFTVRSKRSRILMWNKWLNYPFELLDLMLHMPKLLAIRAVLDYIYTLIKEKIKPTKIVSFKDWFIASFGYTLYKTNCEPYATKHWRIDPGQISSEWGEARSPASFNLKTIIADLITKKYANELGADNPYPDADSFYYPKTGGVGSIANRFADEIRNMGGKIYTEAEITKIDLSGDKAVVEFNKYGNSQKIEADKVVSTISVYILSNLVTPAVPEEVKARLSKLTYLNTIFINVIINRPKISDDSWLYFPQPSEEIIFNRAVEFKNWSEDMAPKDKTSLCLDISCTSSEKIWTEDNDADLIAKAKEGLVRSKIISSVDEVEETFVLKIPFTYPVYDLGYIDNLRPVVESLEKNDKLKLVGRIGKFSYSNMDDVIADGFALANDLMK
ncbi:FAD-dependent oxidoreductase [Candidatus Falkowbacteria bacterium]|uniref:Uncharacterized protein n=1 Tax=Candidatus Buchananbacteria bacterium CG10_big_fil_rev_8_21_14_0_10_33_19 TaxID=1974525 RepID=A0A2H0W5F2_9BACT|nr:FAD-dependent oxidoreductase [Candidatus Falkowbacteria bacterium]PIS05821.1 MAG: hypothetical protein COT80_03585 [Candidatus Buchananbacteria bacterium CG10_big_fil_rev_8_21_14_0_10_33_19]